MSRALPPDIKALVAVRVLNQLGAFVMPFLAVLAGPGVASWALGVFGVAALLSRLLGAFLLGRLAPRTVIVLGLASTGTALLLLAAAHGSARFLVAVALVGLAFELYEPATQEALARLTAPGGDGRPGRAAVYNLLGTSLVASGAVAGLLAAVLLPIGVRWLVVVDAATCLSAAVLALACLDTVPSARGGAPLPFSTGDDPLPSAGRWWPPPALVRLTVAGTAFACGSLAVLMFVPFVLLQRGAPEWLPGLALTGGAVLAPVTGRLGRGSLDRVGDERVLALGTLLLGALALAMAAGRTVPSTVAAYLAWAAVDSLLQGRWPALIADAAPPPDRARWFAVHGSSWGIAQPAVPGLVALTGGAAGAMATAGGAFVLVPLVLVMGARWRA
ncbi:MFS transporter [Actinomadura graeca]|uniref:MFS transporter n=1 Tax=Actinomadura graeca TaxID=2750812 RepID=A0ABX8QUS9_9ACTN|nr:MFS transporter [Actinomadura graeca]QXJ22500.1 MFS transporter [Actinomadura graeca]